MYINSHHPSKIMSQSQQVLASITYLPIHVVEAIIAESRRYEKELERVKREHDQRIIIIQDLALTASKNELFDALNPLENKVPPKNIF